MSADPLLAFRPEFPILTNTTYLISNSLGAMPKAAGAALAEYARYRDDAFRFLVGTPAVPALYAAREGPRIFRRAGDFENALEVSRELNARDVVVDYRPGVGIRMSPHFDTEDAELDHAFAVIDEIRSSGAWRRSADRPAVVT